MNLTVYVMKLCICKWWSLTFYNMDAIVSHCAGVTVSSSHRESIKFPIALFTFEKSSVGCCTGMQFVSSTSSFELQVEMRGCDRVDKWVA